MNPRQNISVHSATPTHAHAHAYVHVQALRRFQSATTILLSSEKRGDGGGESKLGDLKLLLKFTMMSINQSSRFLTSLPNPVSVNTPSPQPHEEPPSRRYNTYNTLEMLPDGLLPYIMDHSSDGALVVLETAWPALRRQRTASIILRRRYRRRFPGQIDQPLCCGPSAVRDFAYAIQRGMACLGGAGRFVHVTLRAALLTSTPLTWSQEAAILQGLPFDGRHTSSRHRLTPRRCARPPCLQAS